MAKLKRKKDYSYTVPVSKKTTKPFENVLGVSTYTKTPMASEGVLPFYNDLKSTKALKTISTNKGELDTVGYVSKIKLLNENNAPDVRLENSSSQGGKLRAKPVELSKEAKKFVYKPPKQLNPNTPNFKNTTGLTTTEYKDVNEPAIPMDKVAKIVSETVLDQTTLGKGWNIGNTSLDFIKERNLKNASKLGLEGIKSTTLWVGDGISNILQESINSYGQKKYVALPGSANSKREFGGKLLEDYRKKKMYLNGGPWDGVEDTGGGPDEGFSSGMQDGAGELTYSTAESVVPQEGQQMGGGSTAMGASIVDAGIQLGSAAIIAQANKQQNKKTGWTPDGHYQTKSGAQGIATGWSVGNKIYPGIGGIIGAFAGGAYGIFKGKKQDKEAKKAWEGNNAMFRQKEQLAMQGQAYNQWSTQQGNPQTQMYKYGGSLPMKAHGGSLRKTSSNSTEVHGPSHANGGVEVPQANAELEGGETILHEADQDYVFSEELGFAELHKKIAKSRGKIEKKPATFERLNSLRAISEKEQMLKQAQETIRSQYNLK